MVSKKANVRDEDIPACKRYLERKLEELKEKRYSILGKEEEIISKRFI